VSCLRPTFHLITTASQESADHGCLDRMLQSVVKSEEAHVYCVARGWASKTHHEVASKYGPALTLIDAAATLSLSEARNLALRQLAGLSLHPGSVVAFPDDDCWYLEDTLDRVAAALRDRPDAAAVSGCYGPDRDQVNRSRFPYDARDLDQRSAVRGATSVTLFIRSECVLSVGGFNPMLGRGTPLEAGEDIDYVLRMIEAGFVLAYRPEIVVGHPHEGKAGLSYAGSFLVVMLAHLKRSPQLSPLLLRGLLGSARVLLLGALGDSRRRSEASLRLHDLAHVRPTTIRGVTRAKVQIDA
jgi:hypothetical protein